jgi:hypothetical protein
MVVRQIRPELEKIGGHTHHLDFEVDSVLPQSVHWAVEARQITQVGWNGRLTPHQSYHTTLLKVNRGKWNESITSPSKHVTSPPTAHHRSSWAAERLLREAARGTHGRRRCDGNLHILKNVLLLLLLDLLRLLEQLLLLLLHLMQPALILISPH